MSREDCNVQRTPRIPCLEVVYVCTDSYLQDVRLLYRKQKATQELIELLSDSTKGIDYSKFINDFRPPNVYANEVIQEQALRLHIYHDMLDNYNLEMRPHASIFLKSEFGVLLWEKYVEEQTWEQLDKQNGVSRATLIRHANRGRVSLYAQMPEEYRRYSIPNAEIH